MLGATVLRCYGCEAVLSVVVDETEKEGREERKQRVLVATLIVAILANVLITCFLGWQILMPGPREIAVGQKADYVANVPRQFEVEKLDVSDLVRNRMMVSEDIFFVVQDDVGNWYALLGLDVQTGCFIHWEEEENRFAAPDGDPKCLQARYALDGSWVSGAEHESGEPLQPMLRLKMKFVDDEVFVIDKAIAF